MLSACRSTKQTHSSSPVIVTNTENVVTKYIKEVRIDTVFVEVKIPAESSRQVVRDSASHLETTYAESDAWINDDGTLGHSISNKPQSIPAEVYVPSTDTYKSNDAERIKEVPVPYEVAVEVDREFTRWEKFRIDAFWWLTGILIGFIGLIFRKQLFSLFRKCLFKLIK